MFDFVFGDALLIPADSEVSTLSICGTGLQIALSM